MVFRYHIGEGGPGEKSLNNFKNDGSFLETFKKLQSGGAVAVNNSGSSSSSSAGSSSHSPTSGGSRSSVKTPPTEPTSSTSGISKPPTKPTLPVIGKRRGGRILPTGKVKKLKTDDESEEVPKDAWSLYLREVKRYRETTCQEEEGKTRPLVK